MNASARDTICAAATPPGRGGVAVVRVSGPAAAAIAAAVLGELPAPRRAGFRRFRDGNGEVIDEGIALHFPAPNSFTGEDVLELQGHGGPVVVDRLLRRLHRLGARPARPGEFSERAFLNDRLDLAQAEAVADLIDAGSEAGARAAMRSLGGAFSGAVTDLADALTALRVYVESAIDFPDEEVDFLTDGEVARRLAALTGRLESTLAAARRGRVLRDGMTVVIAGLPNAGKSSLLNALAGEETAIVTEIAGTTRDTLRERVDIDGMPLHVTDTAGLRDSGDAIEQEGVRRAWSAIERCDRVLLVVDDRQGVGTAERAIAERLPRGVGVTLVHNKIDLSGRAPGLVADDDSQGVAISARQGLGMAALRDHLKQTMGYTDAGGEFSARRRHVDALEAAAAHLDAARGHLEGAAAGEIVAEELTLAQGRLGEITGTVTSDDLLGRIFASFCIGK